MAVKSSLNYFEMIEKNLDERIENIIKINEKYQKLLLYLNSIENENENENEKKEEKEDKKENEEKEEKEEKKKIKMNEEEQKILFSHDTSDILNNQDINQILEKAQNIRLLNDKKLIKNDINKEKKLKVTENKRVRSLSAPRGSSSSSRNNLTSQQSKQQSKQIHLIHSNSVITNQITNNSNNDKNKNENKNESKNEKLKLHSSISTNSAVSNNSNKSNKSTKIENKPNLNYIYSQIQIISQQNLQCPLISILPNKSFILKQYHFLSSLFGFSYFPNSLLNSIILQMINKSNKKKSENEEKGIKLQISQQQQQQYYSLSVYITCLKFIRSEYEKYLENKLNRVQLNTLNDLEIINIFIWWYLLRRCIDIQQNIYLTNYSKTKSNSNSDSNHPTTVANPQLNSTSQLQSSSIISEEQRLHNLISQMIFEYPLLSPIKSSSFSSSIPSSSLHYHLFDYQTQYTMETIISRILLKDVIQELKECCSNVINATSSTSTSSSSTTAAIRPSSSKQRISSSRDNQRNIPHPANNDNKNWKHALQGLQSMETCLINGGMNTGPTIFFLNSNNNTNNK